MGSDNLDVVYIILGGAALYYSWKTGLLDSFLNNINSSTITQNNTNTNTQNNTNTGGNTNTNTNTNTDTPTSITGGSTDSNGIKIPYKLSGKSVKMNYGARHPNGDRYNANHAFQNYYVVGYYLTQAGSGKRLIEMKTDGPNHSGCTSLPKCEWVELDFDISTGQAYISSEYPHPTNHPAVTQGVTAKKLTGTFTGKYVGFGVAAWTGSDGNRVYEEWIDPGGLVNGKPANQWVNTLHAVNTGQIIPNPKRQLPTSGAGLEAEIRMNNQHSTEMKLGTIYEITPTVSSSFARSFNSSIDSIITA